jgi:DNA-binding SARP family transcriptional activator
MARAAVKAKAKAKAPAKSGAQSRTQGRRRHSGGGNPNQQLFFTRLRRQAKWVYVLLAVLFAVTFAFLGVGSGSGGLDQLFSGMNIFGGGGNSVSKAQSYIKKHPNEGKGYRDLATAYESKGDTANAISALQQYTNIKRKDAAVWNELAGLQMTQAQNYLTQYQTAYQNRQLAAPSQSFLPTGKLGTALGENKVEQTAASGIDTQLSDLQQRTQLAYNNALSSYDQVTQITPKDSNAWFQLAQAAQQSGDTAKAVKGYKRYLALNPDSSSKAQILQLIKQLQPSSPTTPSSGKKK